MILSAAIFTFTFIDGLLVGWCVGRFVGLKGNKSEGQDGLYEDSLIKQRMQTKHSLTITVGFNDGF